MCLFRSFSFLEVFVSRQRDHIVLIEYSNIFWSDFCQKRSNFVRCWSEFLVKLVRWSARFWKILVRCQQYLHCCLLIILSPRKNYMYIFMMLIVVRNMNCYLYACYVYFITINCYLYGTKLYQHT